MEYTPTASVLWNHCQQNLIRCSAYTSSAEKAEGGDFKVSSGPPLSSPSRIALEHNYAKLVPFRSFHSTGHKDSSFSTVVLFADKVSSKLKKKSVKSKRKSKQGKKLSVLEEVQGSHGEVSNEEGESTPAIPMQLEVEPR